ncbi:unnamed protein product [Owenia fusiformis]|uniref:Uncharacterized protein n=1 Tax=Owenia fusiformis TaxID=6347 RepID=A0A8J1T857_OWEFU|nr:unnamed protein product [Owenia fusiformis]
MWKGEDYTEHFSMEAYMRDFYSVENILHTESPKGKMRRFAMKTFHEIFEKISDNGNHGNRLFSFGTGPGVLEVISASRYFPYITCSEFIADGRKEIVKWLEKDPNAFDWSPFIQHISKMEGNESEWEEREKQLRDAITAVIPCNSLDPTNMTEPNYLKPFDTLLTAGILDCTCPDIATYRAQLKLLIGKYLKPGGHFIQLGPIEADSWIVNGKTFHSLYMTKEDVYSAWENAGLKVEQFYFVNLGEEDKFSDVTYKATFIGKGIKL